MTHPLNLVASCLLGVLQHCQECMREVGRFGNKPRVRIPGTKEHMNLWRSLLQFTCFSQEPIMMFLKSGLVSPHCPPKSEVESLESKSEKDSAKF